MRVDRARLTKIILPDQPPLYADNEHYVRSMSAYCIRCNAAGSATSPVDERQAWRGGPDLARCGDPYSSLGWSVPSGHRGPRRSTRSGPPGLRIRPVGSSDTPSLHLMNHDLAPGSGVDRRISRLVVLELPGAQPAQHRSDHRPGLCLDIAHLAVEPGSRRAMIEQSKSTMRWCGG